MISTCPSGQEIKLLKLQGPDLLIVAAYSWSFETSCDIANDTDQSIIIVTRLKLHKSDSHFTARFQVVLPT